MVEKKSAAAVKKPILGMVEALCPIYHNRDKLPCFDMMYSTSKGYRVVGYLKNTDRTMNDAVWVGVYPGMSADKIDFMAKFFIEAVQ